MGALRERMDKDMVLRGMATRTRESYLAALVALAKHYHKAPDQLTEQEVQDYLFHLINERKLAWSTCNIATNAFKFFYHVTLKQRAVEFCIPRRRPPSRLPEILSREEVTRLIEHTLNLKHRVLLMTTYAAGLRVSELVHLKATDIDSDRMALRVEQGKGAKDRYTLLSPKLLAELRNYWRAYRPRTWLFPMVRTPDSPINPEQAQKVYYAAKRRAGITKRCGIHGLRHAFATHLLESGVDLHTIQRLLGHGHLSTTLVYFHLAQKDLTATRSPLDLLPAPEPA
jgi:integrase/recombinase XerD